MGIRHTFGLFLTPMSMEHQWSREVFSFALACKTSCGARPSPSPASSPTASARAACCGAPASCMHLGLLGMAYASTGTGLAATAGLMIGAAQSGCTYSVVFAALGNLVPEARRGWAMGVVAAAGSFGQFLMIPVASGLIGGMGWFGTLLIFAAGALLIIPLGSALTKGLVAAAASRARPGAKRCAKPCAKRATCCSTSAISSAASRWCSSACISPPTCSTRASAPMSA
jgi:hypothetical protein